MRVFAPSLSISAPLYGYLKLLKATRKGSRKKDLWSHMGIELGTSRKAAH